MRKICKILVALALVLLCACVLLPSEVWAASNGTCGENVTWTLDDSGTLTISGSGQMYDYVYNDDSPTDASHPWASVATSIKKVVIEDGVTSIGDYAFGKCYNLASISIPNSVDRIGYAAFNDCISLTSVVIPNGVKIIDTFAFCKCSVLNTISLPASLESIENYAFYYCTSLKSVTYCGTEDMWNQISVGKKNTSLTDSSLSYHSWSGSACKVTCSLCNFSPDNGAHNVVNGLCTACKRYGYCGRWGNRSGVTWHYDNVGTLTISGTGAIVDMGDIDLDGMRYDPIEAPWSSFAGSIKSIVIQSGVTGIGHWVFNDCVKATSVTIPSSIAYIDDAVFGNCISLENVYITDLAKWCSIGFFDFDSNPLCQAESLYLNGDLVTDLIIPNGVTNIEEFAFYSCESLTSVTIPVSVTMIAERAFAACTGLQNINVDENNTAYSSDSQGILYNKQKTTLIQAPGGITSCVIPEGVTAIGQYAFRSCANLRTVTIPASVTSIGGYAFNYCHGLRGVYISDLSAWCNIDFGSFSSNPLNYGNILYLNDQAVTELEIPEGVTAIKNFAFFNCKSLTRVIIPKGVTTIGEKAFYNCLNLTNISIPVSMATIAEEAFYNCAALEKVCFCESDNVWEKISIHGTNTFLINASRDHDWERYVCALCGVERVDEKLVYFATPSLSFQDYIGLQVLFKNSVAKDYDSVFVEITQVTPDGVVSTVSEGTPYKSAYRYFEQQIVSWSMTEQVTMTLCGVKGEEVYKGASFTTSVKDLAMGMLVKFEFNEELIKCQALVDMLNYGAAVQTSYNYNANNLPNADLEDFAVYGSTNMPELSEINQITGTGKVAVTTHNVSLQAKVELQMLFKTDVSAYTPKVTVNGEPVEVYMDRESYQDKGYTILRVAVKAVQMRDIFTIALYDVDGNPVTKVYNLCATAYINEQLASNRGAALIALMRYTDSVSKL